MRPFVGSPTIRSFSPFRVVSVRMSAYECFKSISRSSYTTEIKGFDTQSRRGQVAMSSDDGSRAHAQVNSRFGAGVFKLTFLQTMKSK